MFTVLNILENLFYDPFSCEILQKTQDIHIYMIGVWVRLLPVPTIVNVYRSLDWDVYFWPNVHMSHMLCDITYVP